MPLASSCPECRRQVSLPREADPSVWVRCPLCRAEYQLQAAIDFVPPELEVISQPGLSAEVPAVASTVLEASEVENEAITTGLQAVEVAAEQPANAEDGGFGFGIFEESSAEEFAPAEEVPAGDVSAAPNLFEAGEDDDTLPTMEPGSLAPPMRLSQLNSAPQGFREAPKFEPDEFAVEEHGEGNVGAQPDWSLQPESERLPATPTGEFTPSFDATPRRKRKEKSLIGEVLKIVIANVIAFPILYGAILWGFKKDPLQLAQFLPATIVPPEFQAKQPQSKVGGETPKLASRPMDEPPREDTPEPMLFNDQEHQNAVAPTESKTPESQPHVSGGFAGETPSPELELPPAEAEEPKTESPTISPPADSPLVPTTPALPELPKSSEPSLDNVPSVPDPLTPSPVEPKTESPGIVPSTQALPAEPAPTSQPKPIEPESPPTTNLLAPEPKAGEEKPVDPFGKDDGAFPPPPEPVILTPAKPEPKLGPKTETNFAVSDTATAMESVNSAAAALAAADQTDATQLRKLRVAYYTALSQLAEKTTLLGGESSDIKAARLGAAAQLAGVVDDTAKLDELSRLAGFWFNSPKRAGDGIALSGTIQGTSAEGKYFKTDVKLFGSDQVLTVLSAEKPDLPNGSTILVIGVIVKDPAQNLYDYEGQTQDPVVWAGVITDAKQ